IKRRVYPRIFTYSADYPEKVLIATIRDLGSCPCPRCTISKAQIRGLGSEDDRKTRRESRRVDDALRREKISDARDIIYDDGYAVNSQAVEDLLFDESWVPTESAFSRFASQLTRTHFDVFQTLVVDIMHEFELGVWKAAFTQLIRMLHSLDRSKVLLLNERFRMVPCFGRDIIRRFQSNVADMKQLAARDFEDILQCSIPCFEGLFDNPEHDDFVQQLLYLMAYWHSLAKLRMHTTSSVDILDRATTELGKALRHFADDICPAYTTYETDREYATRKRAEAKRASKASGPSSSSVAGTTNSGRKSKTFSLATIKLHFLGDAAWHVRMFGSLLQISTQPGESEHRVLKRRRLRMSPSKLEAQFAKHEVSEWVHKRMHEELEAPLSSRATAAASPTTPSQTTASRNPSSAKTTRKNYVPHHHIPKDQSGEKYYLSRWLAAHANDPAFKDFLPKLKSHLLARFESKAAASDEPDYTREEWSKIDIEHNRIFPHATAGINFTTYDVRREQDTLHVTHDKHNGKLAQISHNGRCNVMVLSNEEKDASGRRPSGAFWYARVLGIFHANVFRDQDADKPVRMEFLWVRWYGSEPEWTGGPGALRLDRIGYVREDDSSGAFGFLDPALVVRACHLIPAFAHGRTASLLSSSVARDNITGDWESYYVARFVDRDMMMRYLGLGVGHLNAADFPHEVHQLCSMKDSEGGEGSGLSDDGEKDTYPAAASDAESAAESDVLL
ncbi:hypothetical protein BD626DRAFT_607153, partial [Schizophyllum amplum]